MNFDYHVHSNVSCDCNETMGNQIISAIDKGLDEICFTEHLEMGFHRGEEWHSDLTLYEKEFSKQQRGDIKIKKGLEVGTTCSAEDLRILESEIETGSFDFVLACVHAVENMDPYMPGFFEGKSRKRVFQDYLRTVIDGINKFDASYYNAIAHIDFPAKGMISFDMSNPVLRYSDAPDEMDLLFTKVIELGKCVEINTSSIPKEPTGFLWEWLHRYRELGGEYITIGSDAHISSRVGHGFSMAREMAFCCGIKYFATYEKMVPTFHRL